MVMNIKENYVWHIAGAQPKIVLLRLLFLAYKPH